MQRTFDRVVHFDERSRDFPIRALVPQKPKSYTWACPTWLDQGQEGACVGFSWSHELAGKPKPVAGITNTSARKLYKLAQTLDEWPGENYSGTSVLAGAKAVSSQGFMSEYRWAFGIDDLILAVGHAGPAVIGLKWWDGMWNVDSQGFVRATGTVVGGHAILCIGVNVTKRYFILHNSWGKTWGVNGECKVSFDDMDKLLKDQGEACIPVVRNLTAKKS